MFVGGAIYGWVADYTGEQVGVLYPSLLTSLTSVIIGATCRWCCQCRKHAFTISVRIAIVENGDRDDFDVTNVLSEVRVVKFAKKRNRSIVLSLNERQTCRMYHKRPRQIIPK